MADNSDESTNVVVCPTKVGNGFKVRLPSGEWLYASKKSFFDMVHGRRKGCVFSPIDEPRA